ncbi:unnamed protein product [Caenorhabditis angaria]|uniref:Uncharacterized protein n=1 Tax=Caenorhabditis angaria TaxID=860376 RepID=A0A9P1ISL3_9PELO|nr:unnamed protein product [Caenorhabditis angaria]
MFLFENWKYHQIIEKSIVVFVQKRFTVLAPTRITPSPVSNVNWNSSPVAAQIIAKQPKPIDPFDVQWSRLAVNPAAENA